MEGVSMAETTVRARQKDELARFLGWFSVALGAAQLSAPRAMCRLVGADAEGLAPKVMRAMGLRELTQGIGILVRPKPTGWLWSRVAGDGLDLSLLGVIAARHPSRRARTGFAIANVLPIAVADVFESRHLAQSSGAPKKRLIRKAVTINRPRAEVEEAWNAADDLRRRVDESSASVAFTEAPGGRGTELAVDFVESANDIANAVGKLTGHDLATDLADELRRLKQQIETGEIVRSDSTPHGHLLADHLKQRPAQPLEEVPS
jgi:hypothetical protein